MKIQKIMSIIMLLVTINSTDNLLIASEQGLSYQEQAQLKAAQIDNYLDTLTEAVFKREQFLNEEQVKLERLRQELHNMFRLVNALLPKDKLRIRHKMNWLDDKIETKKKVITAVMRAENYNLVIGINENKPVSELTLKDILKLEKSFLQFQEEAMQLLQQSGKMLNREKSIESLNELFDRIEALKLKAAEQQKNL